MNKRDKWCTEDDRNKMKRKRRKNTRGRGNRRVAERGWKRRGVGLGECSDESPPGYHPPVGRVAVGVAEWHICRHTHTHTKQIVSSCLAAHTSPPAAEAGGRQYRDTTGTSEFTVVPLAAPQHKHTIKTEDGRVQLKEKTNCRLEEAQQRVHLMHTLPLIIHTLLGAAYAQAAKRKTATIRHDTEDIAMFLLQTCCRTDIQCI